MLPLERDEFPLSKKICFLNHGALGVTPQSIWKRVHEINLETEKNPIHFYDREGRALFLTVRTKLADYVGSKVSELMVLPNATYGINAILKSLRFNPGDEIVITDQEYGAYKRIWADFEQRDGVKVVIACLPVHDPSRDDLLNSVLGCFTNKTKLLFVSQITSTTALLLPVQELCARARATGIMTIVDGAHVPGQIPLNIEAVGADCYVGNCHKWLYAPRSCGFISLREEFHSDLKPLITSWGPETNPNQYEPLVDDYAWLGTVNWANYFALPEALDFHQSVMTSEARAAVAELAQQAYTELLALPNVTPVFSRWSEYGLLMFSVHLPIPAEQAQLAYEFLALQHQIEVQIGSLGNFSRMRICINCYNSPEDIDKLMTYLAKALKQFCD
ncbi:MAG: aminotransferase class V-fold PLP-dependent enzyme [Bdellovibrionales bacterium]|nr:aminotransferase class V-fold PLP-dependent enzyme [Bdellovibrionales bacterium]